MTNNPQIYHGEWWVPAKADPSNNMFMTVPEGLEKKYTGTLTYYGDKDATLELYHVPSNYHYSHYEYNKVLWGKDSNGRIFTLFNVAMREKRGMDFSSVTYVVGMILIGEHVLSISEGWTQKCLAYFPYLNNWIFYETQHFIKANFGENSFLLHAAFKKQALFDVKINDGTCLKLCNSHTIENRVEGYRIFRKPYFEIETSEPQSLEYYFKLISELEQFLSIALFSEQNHSEIEFLDRDGDIKETCKLLLKQESSDDPVFSSLIKYVQLKDKLPSMLSLWHDNFDKVSPISGYLIDSLQKKNRFDVPDFLIIAQALDGYNKRFVNHKKKRDLLKVEVNNLQRKGRDKPSQYEKDINILISQFSDVSCIQKCHIDPKVLAHSRDKYSHLLLDEAKPFAVEGWDLYWLTEKCKILLTCCILNMMGLTNEEINLCCENSPISQIIDSFPLKFD